MIKLVVVIVYDGKPRNVWVLLEPGEYLVSPRAIRHVRPEAMTWCENNGIDYIFGLSGTKPLARKVDEVADDIRTRRAIENLPVLHCQTNHLSPCVELSRSVLDFRHNHDVP